MERVKKLFKAALRSVILGDKNGAPLLLQASNEELSELYKIAESQDLCHIVARALMELGLPKDKELSARYQKAFGLAVYRTATIEAELKVLTDALESAAIPFIPLKGSVLRAYYPEPWMRTSCDIDLLVKESDLQVAIGYLTRELGYKKKYGNQHDVSLYSESGVHLELHYLLVEEGRAVKAPELLASVWDYADVREGYEYCQDLSDPMFYLYHIAHTAKHLEASGSGVRQIVDLYLLDRLDSADKSGREELLRRAGLDKLCAALTALADVWLSDGEYTESLSELEDYLLASGVYGNHQHSVENSWDKQNGGRFPKLRYLFSRLFLPYSTLKYCYPVLQRFPVLFPFMQVWRWIDRIFSGKGKKAAAELRIVSGMEAGKSTKTRKLFDDLGL